VQTLTTEVSSQRGGLNGTRTRAAQHCLQSQHRADRRFETAALFQGSGEEEQIVGIGDFSQASVGDNFLGQRPRLLVAEDEGQFAMREIVEVIGVTQRV
jgi:hypothetical protein